MAMEAAFIGAGCGLEVSAGRLGRWKRGLGSTCSCAGSVRSPVINSCCHARVDQQDKHNSSKEKLDKRGAAVVVSRCEGEAGGEE